jgi:cytochrome c biogenesis protein CcmG, thiol:disulfide interchange protein DsbE
VPASCTVDQNTVGIARDLIRLSAGGGLLFMAWSQMAPASRVDLGARPEPVQLELVSGQAPGQADRLEVGGETGEVTVLEFFASWCSACRVSMPRLERAAASAGVRSIAVSVDDSADDARRAASDWLLPGPVAFDAGRRFAKQLGVRALPTVIVLGPDGTVKGTAAGAVSTRELGELIERARAMPAD